MLRGCVEGSSYTPVGSTSERLWSKTKSELRTKGEPGVGPLELGDRDLEQNREPKLRGRGSDGDQVELVPLGFEGGSCGRREASTRDPIELWLMGGPECCTGYMRCTGDT